jgi:hypothetical protein
MTVAVEVSGADLKLGCFAQTLNLNSNKAQGIPSLDKILGKVRSVVTYFHKSNIATEILGRKTDSPPIAQTQIDNGLQN